LTIAGSDPSGGAGIQADLKTFQQFRVYGEAVVTLLTVQNTRSVSRVECVDETLVMEQLRAVLADIPPQAIKTGALGNAQIVDAIAKEAECFRCPLVIDPVMVSKHGSPLIEESARIAMRERLLPHAALITPNGPEAEVLTGIEVRSVLDARQAAQRLCALGARAALVKGGHLDGDEATDVLYAHGGWHEYQSPRIRTQNTHGTGCTYSAAIAAGLARGLELRRAVEIAKGYITRAIETNPHLGGGAGPVNHFVEVPWA
jgi:hydroxymethylpyrimidine/phosphomethylpyrimidine kinase